MSITVDFNMTRLFIDKTVIIRISPQQSFSVFCPPIKDYYQNDGWNIVYHLWTTSEEKFKELPYTVKTSLDIVTTLMFELGKFDQFNFIANQCKIALQRILPQIELNYNTKTMKVNNIIITPEIWDYVIYVLKLSCGEKVEQPRTFDSPEAREFYQKQKEAEARIRKIKENNQKVDANGVIKNMLAIIYSFPSFTFDDLFNLTMAQIRWLQEYAAGSVSYAFHEKAMAAGNMKKGKKLDFFIK